MFLCTGNLLGSGWGCYSGAVVKLWALELGAQVQILVLLLPAGCVTLGLLLTSLCFSFLPCKTGLVIIVPIP